MMDIGVVGAGAMGNGIAQVAAQSGHTVYVYDTRAEALEGARKKLVSILNRLVEKGRMEQSEADAVAGRVHYVDHLQGLKSVGLVIEAIIENLDAKKSVFENLEKVVAEDAILASNTSSLSIASISSAVQKPERVIGIHFFNPAPLMPLVEIVPSLMTDEKVTHTSVELIDSWKKVTVVAKDTPGFIVNRVARPFYSESIKMYEEGVADPATIDHALKSIGGFRMGPFELTDLIGHDVNYVVTETVWEAFFYDPRFKPSISQKRLMEGKMLGRKTGRGWFDYREGAEKSAPNDNTDLHREIADRVIAMLINEAADAVLMGIASAKDIDLAMTKGVNYPKGLLAWADEIGIETVLGRLEALFEEYGDDRYRPCVLLKRMAKAGEKFFNE